MSGGNRSKTLGTAASGWVDYLAGKSVSQKNYLVKIWVGPLIKNKVTGIFFN